MNKLARLIDRAKAGPAYTVAIANALDRETMLAVKLALDEKLCSFILAGDEGELRLMAQELGMDPDSPFLAYEHAPGLEAKAAVAAAAGKKADIVMKGNVSTKEILQAILNKDAGLRTQELLSHVALFDIPGRTEPVFLTDAAINIAPGLAEKVQIIEHAAQVAKTLGIACPKVAVIAPVDVINQAIPSTLDAAKLTLMQENGEIKGCLVGGPISFDNAISIESARHKGICSKIAGEADILMVPTIEVGNALYKSFIFFAGAKVAAVVCGAGVPIVLPSRADSPESKLYSLALAIVLANSKSNERGGCHATAISHSCHQSENRSDRNRPV